MALRILLLVTVLATRADAVLIPSQPGANVPPSELDQPTGWRALLDRFRLLDVQMAELAALAQDKTVSDDTRAFARRLRREHRRMDVELLGFAQQRSHDPRYPQRRSEEERAVSKAEGAQREALRKLDGLAFEQAFFAYVVASHDRAISLLQREAQRSPNDREYVRLLGRCYGVLRAHRDAAWLLLDRAAPDVG